MLDQTQVFLVDADAHDETKAHVQFLVKAPNHREAWKTAREVCRSGRGALVRDLTTNELGERKLEPSAHTVTRVLSTETRRRGRPPKLTANDLLTLADQSDVRVSQRLRKVIDDLAYSA